MQLPLFLQTGHVVLKRSAPKTSRSWSACQRQKACRVNENAIQQLSSVEADPDALMDKESHRLILICCSSIATYSFFQNGPLLETEKKKKMNDIDNN
jgi:hypothetical protein